MSNEGLPEQPTPPEISEDEGHSPHAATPALPTSPDLLEHDEPEALEAPAAPAPEPLKEIKRQREILSLLLRKTRDRRAALLWLEALIWAAVSLCALCLSALLFAALLPSLSAAMLGKLLAIGVGLILACFVGAAILIARYRPDEAAIGALLQREQPSLRNDIVSAWSFCQQLLDERFDHGSSSALAQAHIDQTLHKLTRQAQDGHLAHLLPQRDLAPAFSALGGALTLLLIPTLFAHQWTVDALTGVVQETGASASALYKPQALERPIVGSLSLTFTYPSYSKLGSEVALFSTGNVDALVGTEVTLQTYTLLSGLKQVELVLKTEAGEQERPLERDEAGRLSGSFVIQQSGSYYFRAITEDGLIIKEPITRNITALPDKAPRVVLRSPTGQIKVSPEDVIELSYEIEDDFGIASLSRAWSLDGAQPVAKAAAQEDGATEQPLDQTLRKAINAPELTVMPKAYKGTLKLDLRELKLQPKDVVTITIEATDNNTLTGPGVGMSDPLILVVASPDDKHLKNIEDQQAVVEALLMSLGDLLEAPLGQRIAQDDGTYTQRVDREIADDKLRARLDSFEQAHKGLGLSLTFMAQVTENLRQDPMMIPRDLAIFEALYHELLALYQRGEPLIERAQEIAKRSRLSPEGLQRLADHAAPLESSLEKGLLRLDELLMSQKMQSVEAAAQEINTLKDRLKTLLEQYRDTKDPELKAEIMREITRLRQRLGELMQRMQSQMKRLPQEHYNMEAVAQAQLESDTQKLVDGFESIESKLEKNDIDGALEALDQMTKGLDSLTDKMKDSFEQPQGLSEFDQEVNALMDEVNDLASAQQKVEQETRALQKTLRQEQRAEIDRQIGASLEKLRQKVKDQREDLEKLDLREMAAPNRAAVERMRDRLNALEKSIDQKDIAQGLPQARKLSQEIEDLRLSMQLSQRYVKRSSDRYDQLKEALQKTKPISQRGDEILTEFEDLMEQSRDMESKQDPRVSKLEGEQQRINEKAQQLKERVDQAGGKFPALKQQLSPGLERANDAMDEAKDGLTDRRMQRALDAERKALDELQQLKQNIKQALQNQRQQDSGSERQSGDEKVEIPASPAQDNKAYREAIQKGMKEERLEDYSSDIESYYKSLTE